MARFKRGESGNSAGRKSGTKNRTSEQFRELIKTFVENNWKGLQTDFDTLKPLERLQFINSMLRHFLPDPVNPGKLTEQQMLQVIQYLKTEMNEKS